MWFRYIFVAAMFVVMFISGSVCFDTLSTQLDQTHEKLHKQVVDLAKRLDLVHQNVAQTTSHFNKWVVVFKWFAFAMVALLVGFGLKSLPLLTKVYGTLEILDRSLNINYEWNVHQFERLRRQIIHLRTKFEVFARSVDTLDESTEVSLLRRIVVIFGRAFQLRQDSQRHDQQSPEEEDND